MVLCLALRKSVDDQIYANYKENKYDVSSCTIGHKSSGDIIVAEFFVDAAVKITWACFFGKGICRFISVSG